MPSPRKPARSRSRRSCFFSKVNSSPPTTSIRSSASFSTFHPVHTRQSDSSPALSASSSTLSHLPTDCDLIRTRVFSSKFHSTFHLYFVDALCIFLKSIFATSTQRFLFFRSFCYSQFLHWCLVHFRIVSSGHSGWTVCGDNMN